MNGRYIIPKCLLKYSKSIIYEKWFCFCTKHGKPLITKTTMVFLKLTFRQMLRQKYSTLINILGLSIGIGSFIIIALYVYNESIYDRFHENKDKIYRVTSNVFNPDFESAQLPARFYEHLRDEIPEVEKLTRVFRTNSTFILEYQENKVRTQSDVYVDPDFLEMFSFTLLSGTLYDFAENPQAAFLTKDFAERLFQGEDPVGKPFLFYFPGGGTNEFMVAGIVDNVPEHSHLQFEVVYNIESMRSINTHMFESWGNHSSTYYVMPRDDADIAGLPAKIQNLFGTVSHESFLSDIFAFHLQPLEDIYLGSSHIRAVPTVESGSRSTIYIFSVSAVLILLLACLNYINLSSAKSVMRSREVGVRKVLGASRGKLVGSFLAESFVMSFIALIVGVAFAELFIPRFNLLSGNDIALADGWPGLLLLVLPGLWIMVSLLSGTYPAFVLSRFNPVVVLKGHAFAENALKFKGGSGLRLRQLLIVVQFAISIGLIVSSLVLYQQTSHAMRHSGFEKESLIVVRNEMNPQMRRVYEAFRNEMEQYPFITHVSSGTHAPTDRKGNQGMLRQPHQPADENRRIYFSPIDYGYFETLGATMRSGRTFDMNFATDSTEAVILNEAAARDLDLMDSIGVTLRGFWDDHPEKKLVGIVEDIHYQSVHQEVLPTAFFILHETVYQPPASYNMLVRFNTRNITGVTDAVEQAWSNASTGSNAASWYFMDERYENLYRSELQTASLSRIMTLLAILIACMGLVGTAFYVMESRRKEFGVRKVLGASVLNLTNLVSKEFSLLIVLSCLIAWPLSFYFMDQWLNNFAYRIDLSPWFFISAGLGGLILALVVVNALTFSHARRNILDSLKYE